MRVIIIFFIVFCCYSSVLYAHKMEAGTTIQKEDKKLLNFSKKKGNPLKIDLFSNQFDFLHHSHQNQLIFALHFLKFTENSTIKFSKGDFDYTINPKFNYNFIFQHLYPKHSFW